MKPKGKYDVIESLKQATLVIDDGDTTYLSERLGHVAYEGLSVMNVI